jgi:diadenosine tetraphosphate (Ap4A) HIT family hydrolase
VSAAAAAMAGHFRADKMNVAALGNVVPQLHVHVIVRRQSDPAWPRPVWGARPIQPYVDDALAARIAELAELLQPLDLQASHGL